MGHRRDELFQQARASALAAHGLTESDLQGAVPKQSPPGAMPLKHTTGLSTHGQTIVVARTETVEFRCIGVAYGWNEEPIYDQAGKMTNNLTPTEEALANAKLWSTAPDLVKALQCAQKLLDKDITYVGATAVLPFESHDQAINHVGEARRVIVAALAKAGAA